MANQEHLDLLKKSVEEWNEWREDNEDAEPDLGSANLSNANLRYVNLYGANLGDANLRDADFRDANLISADLRSADLRDADLRDADLRDANLRFANLGSANLSRAGLYSANLDSANLYRAYFRSADLRFANLSSVDFRSAYLRSADLREADLREAIMGYTTIDYIDLSTVKNLDTVIHDSPSGISTRTFIDSKGSIPLKFLIGAGLSDWEIAMVELYKENLTPEQLEQIVYDIHALKAINPIKIYPVFLSHSWKDKAFTRKLYDALQDKGVRCWLDEKEIKMGEKLIKGISKGISLYDKLVLICSKDSLTSWWVEQELDLIFNKEKQLNEGKNEKDRVDLLIPIDTDGYIFDGWDGSWKTKMMSHAIGDFKDCMENEARFNLMIDQLVEALKVNPLDIEPPSFLPKDK